MFNFNADDLRRRPTDCEHILWNYLRARQMLGLKFRRQHPMGPYIVDFVCLKKKIIIEVDGPIHENQAQYDHRRDQWLQTEGFKIIRVKNEDLTQRRIETLTSIRAYLLKQLGF